MSPPWPWFSALAFGVSLRMVGDRQRLGVLATLAASPGGLDHESPVRDFELLVTRAVIGLVAGRDAHAERAADRIPGLPAHDATSSEDGSALASMVAAVVAHDQPGLDVAASARSRVRMARAGRSAENRARWTFLVDRTVLAVMVEATSRGLTATPGLPDVPVELVELARALSAHSTADRAARGSSRWATPGRRSRWTRPRLVEELRRPSLAPSDLVDAHATYVVAVVRALGRFASSSWHASSGGEWLRDDLFGRQVASVVGRQVAVRSMVRELDGLTMVSLPMLGWLDAVECREAADLVRSADIEEVLGEEPSEDLWQVFDAFTRAATWGTGLVTIYG